jgi:hypothetical protein
MTTNMMSQIDLFQIDRPGSTQVDKGWLGLYSHILQAHIILVKISRESSRDIPREQPRQ